MSEQHVPDLPQHPGQVPEPTGDAAVDAALADLAAIDPGLAPAQQLPALVVVHEALQQRLSSTEA